MGLEVGVIKSLRSLQDDQAAVVGAIWCEVDDALDAPQAKEMWRLIDVRPGC